MEVSLMSPWVLEPLRCPDLHLSQISLRPGAVWLVDFRPLWEEVAEWLEQAASGGA